MQEKTLVSHPTIEQQVTFLYTIDLKKTADFYEKILALDLVLDQGPCRIYRISSDGFLGFCQKEGVTPPHDDVIFTIVTTEVDAWYHYLRQQDVEIENPPSYNQRYNIYHMFLRDPNGYLLEIQTFLDPSWLQK
jgi:catechol 2,3-dioxygenase-like lactoylglutathione lyase family enzyme